jgi:hypothetical protein
MRAERAGNRSGSATRSPRKPSRPDASGSSGFIRCFSGWRRAREGPGTTPLCRFERCPVGAWPDPDRSVRGPAAVSGPPESLGPCRHPVGDAHPRWFQAGRRAWSPAKASPTPIPPVSSGFRQRSPGTHHAGARTCTMNRHWSWIGNLRHQSSPTKSKIKVLTDGMGIATSMSGTIRSSTRRRP